MRKERQLIFFQTTKSRIIYLWPIVLTVLTIFFNSLESILKLLTLVTGASAIVYWLYDVFILSTYKIVLTKQHLVIKQGLLRRRRTEYLLIHITGFEIEQNLLTKLFNTSKITIYIAGHKQEIFRNIKDPAALKDRVNKQIHYLHSNKGFRYKKNFINTRKNSQNIERNKKEYAPA